MSDGVENRGTISLAPTVCRNANHGRTPIAIGRATPIGKSFKVHLSNLNGLHAILATERDFGNLFQSTTRGRRDSPGSLHCVTDERLVVERDVRDQQDVDDWMRLKPLRVGTDRPMTT